MAITRNEQLQALPWQPEITKIIDNKPVRFRDVCVHEIRMGDCEDPDLFVADPIWKWQQTEAGQFIMEHAVETPFWHRQADPYNYGHTYCVVARLSEQDQTYWALKWQKS
jgi:hypothetical protein